MTDLHDRGGFRMFNKRGLVFFRKCHSIISKKVSAGGPTSEQQHKAILDDKYWMILNEDHLDGLDGGTRLNHTANAIKHALQTFGPRLINSEIELINNEGAAKNKIFHAHAFDDNGKWYVLEWTEIDASMYYQPCVHNDIDSKKSRHVYLEVIDGDLSYSVINPAGLMVNNRIKKKQLDELKIKLPSKIDNGNLIKQFIVPHWPILLDLMAKRGDTCINRMIALLNFDKHDNFQFTQHPLSQADQMNILSNRLNINTINRTSLRVGEIKEHLQKKASVVSFR